MTVLLLSFGEGICSLYNFVRLPFARYSRYLTDVTLATSSPLWKFVFVNKASVTIVMAHINLGIKDGFSGKMEIMKCQNSKLRIGDRNT